MKFSEPEMQGEKPLQEHKPVGSKIKTHKRSKRMLIKIAYKEQRPYQNASSFKVDPFFKQQTDNAQQWQE